MNRYDDERYTDLIYHLFYEKKWCSLRYLSDKTNYSKSTIWRVLTFMNAELPTGWRIERNEIKGVRLIKPENGTLESVWAYLKESNTYIQILGLIVLHNGVSVADIIDEVHISRSTVYRQIHKIKEVVESEGVLLTNSPFRLIGDEKKIRRFMMQYLEYTDRVLDSSDVTTFEIGEFKTSLFKATAPFTMSLHMGALHRLATIIDISNLRIRLGCYVSFPKAIFEEYKGSEFFEVAKNMFRYMKKCPTQEIQSQEILFFALYLMNEKKPVSRSHDLKNIRSKLKANSEARAKVLFYFLSGLTDYVGFDISQDDVFLYKLVQTFRRIYIDSQLETDTRVNTMLSYLPYVESNPLFETIENIVKCMFTEENSTYKPIGKVEIFEIFLLVQATMLRKKKQTTIITALICRSYVEMDFIREVLYFHFGNHLEISVIDYTDVDILQRGNEFDLVITTMGLELNLKLSITKISSIPLPAELEEIRQFIDQYFWDRLGINPAILYPFHT